MANSQAAQAGQTRHITVGVLALQGAFHEHQILLRQASDELDCSNTIQWSIIEVRNATELDTCDALVIPGGESTTMALVAEATGLLEPLRDFVKIKRRPTWGTCAGLIFLAESANRTKAGGQELIGGLDVRVNRNHFGRQTESFVTYLQLPFLGHDDVPAMPFQGIFIRAPIVEKLLPTVVGVQLDESKREDTIVAPLRTPQDPNLLRGINSKVEVMARLPDRTSRLSHAAGGLAIDPEAGDIIAVKQGNVFGTSFHPELTQDSRIHEWWLRQVLGVDHSGITSQPSP